MGLDHPQLPSLSWFPFSEGRDRGDILTKLGGLEYLAKAAARPGAREGAARAEGIQAGECQTNQSKSRADCSVRARSL